MRPKKVILIADDNEQGLSTMRFVLRTRGYKTISAATAAEAIAACGSRQIDVALSNLRGNDENAALVRRLAQIAPHLPIIRIAEPRDMVQLDPYASFLSRVSPAEIMLDRVRLMAARKRGPRKGFRELPAPDVIAAWEVRRTA